VDEGGVGAMDWTAVLLLPLVALRRFRRRR
jgi:hypothetical protein